MNPLLSKVAEKIIEREAPDKKPPCGECGGPAESDGWCPRCDDSYRCVCGAAIEGSESYCPACEDADEQDRRLHELAHGPVRLG